MQEVNYSYEFALKSSCLSVLDASCEKIDIEIYSPILPRELLLKILLKHYYHLISD